MILGRAANIRARIPALCAGLVVVALAALVLGVAGAAAASPAKQSAAAIKKAKKRAVKKTTKGVHEEVTSSSTPGLAQPDQGPKIKVSSCKQLRAHHRLSGFKCSWSAQGELPGIVPFRCAGKAKLKANGRKLKRLDGCDNNLEAQAPLLADHHPVAFGYYEDWTAHPGLFDELAGGGAGIARVDLDWRTLQPTQNAAPANWDWAPSDAIYNSMLAVGVHPVFTFIDAPCWAAAGTVRRLGQPAGAAAPRRLRSRRGADRAPLPAGGGNRDLARAQQHAVLGRRARTPAATRTSSARRPPRCAATGSSMPLITGGLGAGRRRVDEARVRRVPGPGARPRRHRDRRRDRLRRGHRHPVHRPPTTRPRAISAGCGSRSRSCTQSSRRPARSGRSRSSSSPTAPAATAPTARTSRPRR